jgi:2-amino-4-hydroxy-6-hydroxymethyldihydropteridine diphosphokinase
MGLIASIPLTHACQKSVYVNSWAVEAESHLKVSIVSRTPQATMMMRGCMRQVADGRWQMAGGRWQMADGRWQAVSKVHGRCKIAGDWQTADGRWQMQTQVADGRDGRWQVAGDRSSGSYKSAL